jgi:hypothetical protein
LTPDILLFCAPLAAHPGVTAGDFPGGTIWYAHADLKQMRTANSGKDLYNWVNGEVFVKIHEEIGIDAGKETDRITAFADGEQGAVVIVEGPVSQETKDKILALAASDMDLNLLNSGGKDY